MSPKGATASLAAAALSAFGLALPTLLPSEAAAQSNFCAKRDMIVSRLQATHGEIRQSFGLQKNNGVMETFANPETGTWTIIVSLPTGMSCLVAVGEAYEADEEKVSLLDDSPA